MVQKTINDYYEQIYKEFPDIPKSDIKRILQYGWKQLYLHNSYGCDVVLQRKQFWMYIGKLMKNSIKFHNYYKKKLQIKLRLLYKRNKIEWDGYYYFALRKEQYDQYKAQLNVKGRPKKYFTFSNVKLRKIYDECLMVDSSGVAIFRIPFVDDLGFDYFIYELKTDKAQLILEKDPTKLSDMLISNYDYKIFKDKKYK